jgi:hypothetical protein
VHKMSKCAWKLHYKWQLGIMLFSILKMKSLQHHAIFLLHLVEKL